MYKKKHTHIHTTQHTDAHTGLSYQSLIKITYRPDPEYFFDVELGNNDVVQVHAKSKTSKMDEVKQMRKLVADNTSIFPPIIKQNEFQKILDGLWATKKDMPPPIGTNPIEILKEELIEYVNGPEAKPTLQLLKVDLY